MTLSTTSNRNDYLGTGTTGPFAFTFKIFAATDLAVTRRSGGVDTPHTYPSDYTVAGVGDESGGSITLATALAVGETLVLRRIRPVAQPTSIRNQGSFLPEIHEDAFDHALMVDQQHEETLGRALQLPVSTRPSDGVSNLLPAPVGNKLLGWDPTGKAIVNSAGTPGPTGPAGPALVADQAARDALFPAPAGDQRVVRKDTGQQERYDAIQARWLPEGVTRAAGPIVGSKAKGARADGVSDDSTFLTAVATALAGGVGIGELDPGVHRIAANIALAGHYRPLRGHWLTPSAGVTVTISGTVEDVGYAWIDESLGGRVLFTNSTLASIPARWFKEATITVPNPTLAVSTLTAQQDGTPGGAGQQLIVGHTYEYGYTYVGYDGGQTLMSPVTQIVGQTGFECPVIQFFGTLTCRAIGVMLYWRDVTAAGAFKCMTLAGKNVRWGFGDMTDATGLYGVVCANDPFSPGYPGVATAHDQDGTVLTAPTIAPVVNVQQVLPINTNFYVAYSYTCQDGTETALSPVAGPVATPAQGGCLRFYMPGLPPSGAMSTNVYVGTASGALKKQINVPLHHIFIQVNSYNAAGAANAPGARQSTISPLQQAWDAVRDSGAGREILVDSLQRTFCPLIFGQSNLVTAAGIRVRGTGGPFSNSQGARIDYVGPAQANLTYIVSSSSATVFENLAFWDDNGRMFVGLGFCDPYGGNSFYNVWENVSVTARAAKSCGVQASNHSSGAGAHTVSEQRFNNCSFNGTWCVDVRGYQTANFRFHNLQTFSFGNQVGAGDMDSGDVRYMTDIMVIHEHFAGAHGGHVYFLGDETAFRAGGGSRKLYLSGTGTELDNGGPMYIYNSDTNVVGSYITIAHSSGALNNLGRSAYDIYCGAPSQFVLINTVLGNNVVLDHFMATLVTLGIGLNVGPATGNSAHFKRTTRFQAAFPGFPAYFPPIAVYGGGIGYGNDSGIPTELRKISGTKAAVDPANLVNGATQLVTTMTVTGAVVGDAVDSVVHTAPLGTYFFGVVTAPDTVTVYQSNYTGGAVDVAAGTLTAIVTKKIQ